MCQGGRTNTLSEWCTDSLMRGKSTRRTSLNHPSYCHDEIYTSGVYAYETRVRKMHACEVHANEMHADDKHAHNMHAPLGARL